MSPTEVQAKDMFPAGFLPLPHPNHPEGGINGVLNPKQLEGVRLLVTPFPQQQFNQTDYRRAERASRGVACFDRHANGHTNASTVDSGGLRIMTTQTTVAIINTAPDTIELLRHALQTAGFLVCSCYTHDVRDGKLDLEAFMRQHRPRVIVYDLAPPYEPNIRLFQHIRAMPAVAEARFVLTSVNPSSVISRIGNDERVYEVVDREEDLLALVQAVKEASRARPTH